MTYALPRKLGTTLAAVALLGGSLATISPVVTASPAQAATCTYQGSLAKPATVKRGSTGKSVSYVQCLLRAVGYSYVTTDGVFGAKTQSAVEDWQRKHPYLGAVDGVVGPQTLSSLKAGAK